MKKNSLLKFALIPIVLLLLIFTSPQGQQYFNHFGGGGAESLAEILEDLNKECTSLYTNNTYSSDADAQEYLMSGETVQITITVPPGTNIYAILEWNFNFCEEEEVDFIGLPWGDGGGGCTGEVSLRLFNGISTLLDVDFYAPYNNYGEGTVVILQPGEWTFNMTNNDLDVYCYMCYDITIRVYGCFYSGGHVDITPPPKPP